jgi:hypothetical protein
MRNTLFKILGSALIAALSIQLAAAAGPHSVRKPSRKPATVHEQLHNSNEQLRNSSVTAVCGLFPGPCQ